MTPHPFYVVTRNCGGTYTVCFSGTRAACRRWILGRYRHHPPFAVITPRTAQFERCF